MENGRTRGQAWAAKRFSSLHVSLVLPIVMIAGYAIGQTIGVALVGVACTLALGAVLLRPTHRAAGRGPLHRREDIVQFAEDCLWSNAGGVGVFTLEIDRFKSLNEQFDHLSLSTIAGACAQRLAAGIRAGDVAAQIDRSTFVVVTGPEPGIELENAIQIASRLQATLSKPVRVGSGQVQISVSVGFCLSNRLRETTTEGMFLASTTAMIEAQRNGPGAIRSYSDAMRDRIASRRDLALDVGAAFDTGQITASFQPQLSTEDRTITGFEALARWHHPRLGPVSPADFLPAMRDAGALNRLGQLMVQQALQAINEWDRQGFDIPRVAVNFSSVELSNPHLVDDIRTQLAVHSLTADRLGIEVLETVIASEANSTLIDNLAALADLGCTIDLDDFGTGHASITSIRQFSIGRIKIDRSFVSQIDDDREQQDMVAAILTMADRLGVDALAEGVETQSEEMMLARLGCGHIQGFGVAHPMPLSETSGWITGHVARLASTSQVVSHALRRNNAGAHAPRIGKTA